MNENTQNTQDFDILEDTRDVAVENQNVEQETPAASETPQQEQIPTLPDSEDIPEKFRGKPVTEVLKSYQELEKQMGEAGRLKGEIAKLLGMTQEEEKDELKEIIKRKIRPDMSIDEFAETVLRLAEERATAKAIMLAQEKASETISQTEAARREVEAVKAKYPEIETNEKFQDMVLALVEAKGMTLQEAADEVAAIMGVKANNPQEKVAKENQHATIEEETVGQQDTTAEDDDILGLGGVNKNSLPGIV